MKLGIVIPATHGREHNLQLVLASIRKQGYRETQIVVVDDGGQLGMSELAWGITVVPRPKHEPGMEQPRNVGVRHLAPDVTHVWFLDSDVVVKEGAQAEIHAALRQDSDRVLVCPYDWLGPGIRPTLAPDSWPAFWSEALRRWSMNDPRWEMFRASPVERVYTEDLSAGLACFSGNLVWPVDRFQHVGGFWSEIHHGRCEDGELGLRAVAMQVPISLVAEARGFHLWHEVDAGLAVARNARDVPMLNTRHPWVERGAVFLTDRDGGAFDVLCLCGKTVHTIGWWEHAASCDATGIELPVAIP